MHACIGVIRFRFGDCPAVEMIPENVMLKNGSVWETFLHMAFARISVPDSERPGSRKSPFSKSPANFLLHDRENQDYLKNFSPEGLTNSAEWIII